MYRMSQFCDSPNPSDENVSVSLNMTTIYEEDNDDNLTGDGLYSNDLVQGENFSIFSAVSSKNLDGVEKAIREGVNVNAQSGIMQITVLHIASAQKDSEILNVLLKAGANPKAEDKLGRTPLHMAASVGSEECVGTLLLAGANPNVAYRVKTLPHKKNEENNVEKKNESEKKVPLESLGLNLPFPECWGRTPLHLAVKANHPGCVRRLLEAGASVDAKDECGITPLLLAGKVTSLKESEEFEKYEELVEILLTYGAKANVMNNGTGETPLHHAAREYSIKVANSLLKHGADPTDSSEIGSKMTALHVAADNAAPEIISAILESIKSETAKQELVNSENSKGCTALHLAAHAGCHFCVSLLMDAGADLGATTTNGVSALEAVLLYIPRPAQCLGRILDSRIRPNAATIDEKNFAVQLDFKPLAPHGMQRQTVVMRALLEADGATHETRRMILSHPLVESFIVLKWRRLRLFFYFLVAVYVAFAISLSAYITLIHCDITRSSIILESINISRRILLFSSCVVLLNVIGQCAALPKYYLKQFELWMNLVSAICSIVVAAMGNFDGDPETSPHLILANRILNETEVDVRVRIGKVDDDSNHSWVLHVTSVTVLLSWAELMLLIGRFPTWGSHALLFYAVLKNVVKVLLAFGCMILGFSFSFFVQFHKSKTNAFGDPWKSFVKTMVMMMGEFEYLDLFEERKEDEPLGKLIVTSRVIFVCFVVLTSIVLVNLMVGLAVSDTQALRSEGEARRLLKQAEFVAHLERGVSAASAFTWLPKRVIKTLSKRRSIPLLVTIRPSVAMTAPAHKAGHHLPRRLLEDLVTIALQKRADERKRNPVSYPEESTTILTSAADTALLKNSNLLLTLERISRDIAELKDMLDSRYGYDAAPSVLRIRKWSSVRAPRPTFSRFSNLVTEVTNAQNILKRMSKNDGSVL